MRNPLNDIEAFSAVCGGAGFAFGVSALLTLGHSLSYDFAKLSVVSLVISAIMYIMIKLYDEATKKSSPTTTNSPELDITTNQKDCNVIISSIPLDVKTKEDI